MSYETNIVLDDVENHNNLSAIVYVQSNYIAVGFKGYGEKAAMPGSGSPVLIENRDGIPHVIIWGDINDENPTHTISLENALESKALTAKEDAASKALRELSTALHNAHEAGLFDRKVLDSINHFVVQVISCLKSE